MHIGHIINSDLITYLLEESGMKNQEDSSENPELVYRALVNLRKPNPISEEYLKVEDDFLS